MKICEEKNIKDFKFWAGARDFAKRLTDDEWELLEDYFNDYYPDGLSSTELTDCFWFGAETLLEVIAVDEDEFWDR